MAVLLGINVRLRLVQPNHPHPRIASPALQELRSRSETLHVAQWNIVEFCAVTMRLIAVNGLGFSIGQALAEMNALAQFLTLLPGIPLHRSWERLVADNRAPGKNAHDARLVAAKVVHGIENISTLNVRDSRPFDNISTLDPAMIA